MSGSRVVPAQPWTVARSCLSWLRTELLHGGAQGLLTVDQVPDLMKEPYILTGYRRLFKPWGYYLFSFLQFHNESLNVWTHAVGIFIVLRELISMLQGFDVTQENVSWPIIVFGASCMTNMALSATAHLCHSKSQWHHYLFFLMDYSGVTIFGFGTGIGSMYICSPKSFHDRYALSYLVVLVLSTCFSFYACCVTKILLPYHTARKPVMVAGVSIQAFVTAVPNFMRYAECLSSPSCSLLQLNHLTIVFLFMISCAVIFIAHAPERWGPGCFDVFGHSHQIFHAVAVLMVVLQFRALQIDVNVLKIPDGRDPTTKMICLAFACVMVVEAVTLVGFARYLSKRVAADEHRCDGGIKVDKDEASKKES